MFCTDGLVLLGQSHFGGDLIVLDAGRCAKEACEPGDLLLIPPNARLEVGFRLPQADRPDLAARSLDEQIGLLEALLLCDRWGYQLSPELDKLLYLVRRRLSRHISCVHG